MLKLRLMSSLPLEGEQCQLRWRYTRCRGCRSVKGGGGGFCTMVNCGADGDTRGCGSGCRAVDGGGVCFCLRWHDDELLCSGNEWKRR